MSCASSWSQKGGPGRASANGAGGLRGFQVVTCRITGRDRPGRPCQPSRQTRMPERTLRPLSAILCHQESELRAVANFHKGEKRALSKKMAIISTSVTEPTLDVLVFLSCWAKARSKLNQKEWLSTKCCLFLSGEKRQGIGGNHKCQSKTRPGTSSTDKGQWPHCPARPAKWPCGSAVYNSHHAQRREA